MPGVTVKEPAAPMFKRHYTIRKSPYLVSLILLLATTTLTLLNIYVPQLVHVIVRSPGPTQFETRYGLYRRCTRSMPVPNSTFLQPSHPLDGSGLSYENLFGIEGPIGGGPKEGDGNGWVCQPFPTRSECQQFGEKFCVLWSTSGYAAQLSLVPCLASLISLLFIFLHRGQRTARAKARRQQWKLVSGTMIVHCILQILSIALILHVFRTDERFETKGSHLDQAFWYGIASAIISGIMALLLTYTALAARAGQQWAAGKSARKARRHRRTRSGRVVPVPEGTQIPPEEVVTVGEVHAAQEEVTERTGLLAGQEGIVAGGQSGGERATDSAV
ncbi:hypothetical protein CI109_103408 [Kwoniella shandongensis]|uniref:Uncharacterized protein n=1 Tax=Kwoniella shandongensis TaxID=1734106 RepID=A0A5M6BWE3_9TREE|nr:uncharacterized protein CI109_004489 [Kwoniella shandongensis]KAA5527196.1 hypothetical protein CI109_004489 [Kwoniella shandongensis]